MCYSAMLEQRIKALGLRFSARIQWGDFERLFRQRLEEPRLRIPRALEDQFQQPESAEEERIRASILAFRTRLRQSLELELTEQRERLARAERRLALRATQTAEKERRIAQQKIDRSLARLQDLKERPEKPQDSRIFPFFYAALVVTDQGQRVIRPLRYHLRPFGKPASIDQKYPGLYNARRDKLNGFWRDQYGRRHALCLVTRFFENVPLTRYQHRPLQTGEPERNVVVEFVPQSPEPMAVACLWDDWEGEGEPSLSSFAMVTDNPPPDVAEAGHDRCIVSLVAEAVEKWLTPQERSQQELDSLLDGKRPPRFAHRRVDS